MLFHANVFPSLKQCFFHSGKKEHGTCTPIVCPSMPVQTSLLYPQSVSLKVCLLKFKNMTIKIQNSKTWPSKPWPSNCISQSMSLTIQKHDPQNSKFKNMTFRNMTLKVYLSKHYCISQKFSKYVPKNSKHDHHNSKTWPSKCISQSITVSLKNSQSMSLKIQNMTITIQKHDPQSVSLKVLLYLSKILKVCP